MSSALSETGNISSTCTSELATGKNVDYVHLVAELKKANIIRDIWIGLRKSNQNSMKGDEFIRWIMREKHLGRREAVRVGRELVRRYFGHRFNHADSFQEDRIYQLREEDNIMPLNASTFEAGSYISAADMNANLVNVLTPIYEQIVSTGGKAIKYSDFISNEYYNDYLKVAHQMQYVDIKSANRNEKLALFLNIYNVMIIHIFAKFDPPRNIWIRRKYWYSTYYIIGGELYSLQSILNGILRGNRVGVGMIWPPFGPEDRRLNFAISPMEPSIHFAITSGGKSTNPLHLYTIRKINEELKTRAIECLRLDDYIRPDRMKGAIYVSKIFKWYAEDFGGAEEEIMRWIWNLLEPGSRKQLLQRIFCSSFCKIEYINYDWSTNWESTIEINDTVAEKY